MLRVLRRVALAAALAAGAAACSAMSSFDSGSAPPQGEGDSAAPQGGYDGGGADGGTVVETGAGDDATSGEDAPSPEDGGVIDGGGFDAGLTTVIFLHASPSLPSVRLCWDPTPGTHSGLPPFPATNEMPASNYAGIPVGGAVWLNDATGAASMLGFGQLYALRAKIIAADPPTTACDQYLCIGGQNCRTENLDYWPLGFLGSLVQGGTNVVAVAGCLGADDPLATPERCGPTWNPATGNLHLEVIPVPAAATGDAGLLVQAAQLSPGLQALGGEAGAATVSFGPEGDAGAPIAQLAQEGDLQPSVPVPIALPSSLASFGQLGFSVDVAGDDASAAGHLWMSLAQAQQLVSPAQDPAAYYGAGGTYVVAVMGDPDAPHAFAANADGGYDGRGLHLLLLPALQASP